MSHSRLRWIALIGISVLAFTAYLDATIVNTALPFIQKAFDAPVLELQWVTNIFTMILAMTMVASGRFADLYGRKKVFYLGVAIFAIAALAAGFSPSIGFLIFFRGLQGLGASIIFVASASLITNAFPKEEHNYAIGIYGGITGLGLAIGPLAGGFLVAGLGWRWVFWINLPLIILGSICCALSLKLPLHIQPNTKIDKKGLFLLISGLGALIYGIIESAHQAGTSKLPWGILAIGILILIYFLWSEGKSASPLIDLSIFKDKLILLTVLSVTLAGVVSTVFMFFDPLYLRNLRHLSALSIGFYIAAIPVAQVAISFLFPALLKWLTLRYLMAVSVVSACVAILLHRCIGVDTPLVFLLLPFAILGINWGLSNAGLVSGVNQSVAPAKVGEAIGTIATVWNLAGSIILAISSAIFHLGSKTSFIAAFHRMIDFNILFAFLILTCSVFLLRQMKRGYTIPKK